MKNVKLFYNRILDKALIGEYNIKCYKSNDGNNDTMDLVITKDGKQLKFKNNSHEYTSQFILFYPFKDKDGLLISSRENWNLESAYSFTEDGYGEGIEIQNGSEMWNKIIKCINKVES